MKTAIYIEDGVVQLVLTPESEFEKNAMGAFDKDGALAAKLYRGSFYDCRGGWTRQQPYHSGAYGDSEDRSLIIRVAAPVELK
jgi:hypothetical protein